VALYLPVGWRSTRRWLALYFVGCAGRLVQTCGDVANRLVLYTAVPALYFVGCAGRLVHTCGDVANWLVLYTATIAKQ
jgi:hypothetical protein